MAQKEAQFKAALLELSSAVGKINISLTAAKHKITRKTNLICVNRLPVPIFCCLSCNRCSQRSNS